MIKDHKEKYHSKNVNIAILKCEHCTFMYTKSNSLQYHQTVHNPKAPFQCSECDYKTSNYTNFNKHILTNSKDRLYRCSNCNRCFTDSGHLQRHIKFRHSD